VAPGPSIGKDYLILEEEQTRSLYLPAGIPTPIPASGAKYQEPDECFQTQYRGKGEENA
jgi:hypothetical protein